MWIVFLSRSWWINSSSDGKVICFFFFFLPSQSYAIIYTCSFPFSNRFSLHYYFFVFVFVLILILILIFSLSLSPSFNDTFSLSSFFLPFHLLARAARIRNNDTAIARIRRWSKSFLSFFFFLLAGKIVRWMSMQCAHVCFLRYFKRFFQNGGIDGSRRSSKCRVANTFLTVVEENRNDLDDLVKIPTYLVRCIV